MVIKAAFSQGQQYHIIRTEVLGAHTQVSQMKLSEEGNVYVATDSGIYGISVTDCSVYTDCCSCVAARDPFCAFDTSSEQCVAVSSLSNANLVQNVSTGRSDRCPSTCIEKSTSEPATATKATTSSLDCAKETTQTSTDVTPGLGMCLKISLFFDSYYV